MILIIGWILLSVAVGIGARNRYGRCGPDWFVLSLAFSPLIAAAFLLAAGPKVQRQRRHKKLSPPPLPNDDLDGAIRALRASGSAASSGAARVYTAGANALNFLVGTKCKPAA